MLFLAFFFQECFNTFSTLILIYINFGTERKHVIFIDTHLNDHVPDLF